MDTPALDARLLLAWTLKVRHEDLVREPHQSLTERERLIFEKAVSLRVLRRPLPYITGEAWFYGRCFKINRAVLIPRPETELLVQAALEKVAGLTTPVLADIGTGSGCIAVTLAAERPDAILFATDLSEHALLAAAKNKIRHSVCEQVTLLQGDLLSPLPFPKKFDLIVSNPPYLTQAEVVTLMPEVRDYEPHMALSGVNEATGSDGTQMHRRLLSEAPAYLKAGGHVLLEVGQGQAERVMDYARSLGSAHVSVIEDYSGIQRIVTAQFR